MAIKTKSLAKLVDEVACQLQRLVRLKAANDQGMIKCCSCHRWYHWKEMDGGHYISRKYTSTKIMEENINSQCKSCNGWGDASTGHQYYIFMVDMYGKDFVEKLEAMKHVPTKHNRAELMEMKKENAALIKQLEREAA